MPRQEFIQPRRNPDRDDDGMYHDSADPLSIPTTGRSSSVSKGAQNTLDNIDDVLGDRPKSGSASLDNLVDQERNPGDPVSSDSSALSPGVLATAEGASAADGFEFNPENPSHRGNIRMVIRAAGIHKKHLLIGGGGLGAVGALVAILFFMLIPLKIENIVTNLQNHFFASSESAVDTETENMLSKYVKKSVLPALKKCKGKTVSKACNPVFTGNNPVDALFRGWQNARLEDKLSSDYGIEFRYDSAANKYYMKAPGLSNPSGDDITSFASDSGDLFEEVDRGQIRQEVRTAFQNETKLKQVLYRFKVGRLLEEKYGVRRCLAFCGATDTLQDFTKNKANAAQIFLVQRVLGPRNAGLAVVMECLLDPNCEPEKTQPEAATPGSTEELAGEPGNPETDDALRTSLQGLAAKYGITDTATVEGLVKDYEDMSSKGYKSYAVDKFLESKGLADLSAENASDTNVVGWITLGAQVIKGADTAGPKLRKLTYLTNATAAVSLFSMYRTYADEIHTGHIDPTEAGSMVNSLGPGNHGSGDETGGTAGAEDTPLYSTLMGDGSTSSGDTTSLLDNILPAKAYADPTGGTQATSSDICANGKPVPAGKVVCPEEVLGQGEKATLSNLHDFLSLPGINIITEAAGLISSVASGIQKIVGSVINYILQTLGLGSVLNLLNSAIQPVFNFAINKLIVNPFGNGNLSGGRTFDMMAAGADVAGNDYAHTGLGGQELTTQQASAIQNQQQQEAKQQFSSESFFARMFSTTSPYSLVSKIAVDMPVTSASTAAASFGSLLSNPFNSLFSGFSSIFTAKAGAAASLASDPFAVTQYGYPAGTIPSDPETYWNQHCSDNPSQGYQNDADSGANGDGAVSWNQQAANSTVDPNTGEPVNTTTNPCLLIEASVGAAGGAFDSSLLTQDDLADINNGAGAGTTSTAGSSIDMSTLYQDSTSVACAAGTNDIGNYTGYYQGQTVPIKLCAIPNLPSSGAESNGQYGVTGANGDAVVNSRVSGAVLAMVTAADASGLKLTSDSTYRSMAHQEALCPCNGVTVAKPGYSNHQMGLAIDFSNLPGTPGPVANNPVWTWLNGNASKYGYYNYPQEAWHWSPTGN